MPKPHEITSYNVVKIPKQKREGSTFYTIQHFIPHVHLLAVIVQHRLRPCWKNSATLRRIHPHHRRNLCNDKSFVKYPHQKVYWIVSRHSNRFPSIMYTECLFRLNSFCLFVCVRNEIQECEDNDYIWKSLVDILRLDGSFTFYSSDSVTNLNDIKLCFGWFDLASPWLCPTLLPSSRLWLPWWCWFNFCVLFENYRWKINKTILWVLPSFRVLLGVFEHEKAKGKKNIVTQFFNRWHVEYDFFLSLIFCHHRLIASSYVCVCSNVWFCFSRIFFWLIVTESCRQVNIVGSVSVRVCFFQHFNSFHLRIATQMSSSWINSRLDDTKRDGKANDWVFSDAFALAE